MEPITNVAITAAREAGTVMLRGLDRIQDLAFKEKTPQDFVSEVDLHAEAAIVDVIHQAYPRHSVLAEEGGVRAPVAGHNDSDIQWIVDPLDGTTNYLHGIPHFAVSIAVKEKHHLQCGVIYNPATDELFTAERGRGAQLNGRRLRVSDRTQLSNSLLATGFPFRDKASMPSFLEGFQRMFAECSGIRRMGSAALDLAYVAAGRLDGYWEYGLAPWDVAAGALMVREAGGMVSDISGGDNFLSSGNILAANPKVFKQMLRGLAG